MSTVQNVRIRIRSVIDQEEILIETTGEYRLDGDTHLLAYTDYAGNQITKNGLFIGPDSMLLHRVGAFSGDMLFDPKQDTGMDYQAAAVGNRFRIHTSLYAVSRTPAGISVKLVYQLNPQEEEISAEQEIEILF